MHHSQLAPLSKARMFFPLLFAVTVVLLSAGCSSPPKHPFIITPGGYLEDKDYAALQKAADLIPPSPLPKSWPNPTPRWSYYVSTNFDYSKVVTVSIPDLEPRATVDGQLTKIIPDRIGAILLSAKLAKDINRSNSESTVALVGAITRFKAGAAWKGTVFGAYGPATQDFAQTEFKIMVDGKPVGAIQSYGVRARGLGGWNMASRLATMTLEDQVATGVANALLGLKANVPTKAADDGPIPEWFEK